MEKYTARINILKALVLELENELELYKKSLEYLQSKYVSVLNTYKASIQITQFLREITNISDPQERKERYNQFLQKDVKNGIKYKDIFKLDLDSFSEGNIKFGMTFAKGLSLEYMWPENGDEKIFQVCKANTTIGEKVVVEIVRAFEYYFRNILQILVRKKPKLYLHDKTISYETLISSKYEDLQESLINQCVESLLFDTVKTLEKINKFHGLKLENYGEIVDSFKQIILHRNIIEHNDSVINTNYIKNLPERFRGIDKINQKKICDLNYISNKINDIIKLAYLLYFMVNRSQNDLNLLEEIAYNFLKDEQWDIAEFAHSLLEKVPNYANDRLYNAKINKLNAQKHLEGLESLRSKIENLDVSGMSDIYILAKLLLLEKNEEVTEFLESHYGSEECSMIKVQTWPIFIEYRKTQHYRNFISRHKEDFEQFDYDKEVLSNETNCTELLK